jgi:hypothetical protein
MRQHLRPTLCGLPRQNQQSWPTKLQHLTHGSKPNCPAFDNVSKDKEANSCLRSPHSRTSTSTSTSTTSTSAAELGIVVDGMGVGCIIRSGGWQLGVWSLRYLLPQRITHRRIWDDFCTIDLCRPALDTETFPLGWTAQGPVVYRVVSCGMSGVFSAAAMLLRRRGQQLAGPGPWGLGDGGG